MVMEVYAMESCLLRAQKAAANKGEAATQTMLDAARVFISDAAERVEHEARRALTAVNEGDMLTQACPGGYHCAPPQSGGRGAIAGSLPVRKPLNGDAQ
jgi:hypothetical protein